MSDPRLRSLAKTISYRAANMLVSFTLFTFITGSLRIGGMLVVGDAILSSMLFYYHERLWTRIKWRS